MGEAKRSGNATDNLDPIGPTGEFTEMPIPNDREFLGYVVYVPETDDYLGKVVERRCSTERRYVRSPEGAMKFETKEAARKVAKGIRKRSEIGSLYDIGEKLMVSLE